ncbi:MAG: YeeE/YedE family protein [Dehalococcoidia bacterium]
MHDFTPLPALLGGALIGLSTSALLLFNGRIAGISGIFGGLLVPKKGEVGWRIAFLAGLLAMGSILAVVYPAAFPTQALRPLGVVAVAGLLVGFGTRLGNGCTSGHGVCGISRMSARSIVATISFMAAGAVSVFISKHILGAIG